MNFFYIYNTVLGYITIITDEQNLIEIDFGENYKGTEKETNLIKNIKKQIDEYLLGNRKEFDIPIKLNGTEFQLSVWDELRKIGYGEYISYQELARRVKNEKYARAVGYANNKNPIPIIIPCHRVINKNNSLGGYASGLNIKTKLLEIEKVNL